MTDPVDLVLSRLDKSREVAPGRWRARCPGHDGKNRDALAITRGDDGRVLLKCFHGCEVEQVVARLGLQLHDLFVPAPSDHRAKAMRQPFVPAQVFDVVLFEVAVMAVTASDMHREREISQQGWKRLQVSQQRLDEIARGAYGQR